MNILIVGGGGREHALAWKVAQSPLVTQIFVAPGNTGTALEPKVSNISIDPLNIKGLIDFAKQQAIALTIVGPEAPLVAGIVDSFREAGFPCFGPTKSAAQLEASKVFSKEFMQRHGIPTAKYATFTDINMAKHYILQQNFPIVIKAEGLAAGKGVIIAQTQQEALQTLQDMLGNATLGVAGQRVVIEEFLVGEEASFMVVTDSQHVLPLATSQDHKTRDDGDRGPNTGGMGAYSPAPVVTPELHERILQEIVTPTITGMAAEGHPYQGFLYVGLMITPQGELKVLEYNCRLGDPETQPILCRLQSDLVVLCLATLDKQLDEVVLSWDPRVALGVVLTASGYPGPYKKGSIIQGLHQKIPDVKVFHAGTALQDDHIIAQGGRVLCVTALGKTVREAQKVVYDAIKTIYWDDMYYRTDIGYRALTRELPR